jgi:hypothetical protein
MKLSYRFFAFLITPALVLAQGPNPGSPASTPAMNPATAPKVACLKPKFDFGNQDEGPDITHEFRCRNLGHGKLIVSNVSTSCGCTAAVIRKSGSKETSPYPATFEPGEIFYVKATYHTNGRPGHATKIITISSNDPVNPAFQLQLDMTVQRDVDVQPDRVYLYGIKHGQDHPTTIKILGKAGEDLQILSAAPTGNVVTVTSITPYRDDSTNRSGATIQVDAPATLAIGTFTDNLTVKTNNPKKPEISVPVMGEVVGPVQFNPKTLSFAPHQEMPVTVTFTVDNPQTFSIRSVDSLHHLVRPSIIRTANNGVDQYALAVSVIRNIPKDSDGKDEVEVYTNDPEMSKISIDVQANK